MCVSITHQEIDSNHLPSVNSIRSHVHTGNDHCSQTILFISQYIVCPCKERGLAGVYASSPVVHAEDKTRVVRICENESTGNDASNADPVSDQIPLAAHIIGEGCPEKRRHYTDCWDAGRIIVKLGDGIFFPRV